MCGNEPCAHERDYTTAQAMKSYVAASSLAGDAAIERDALKAALARVAALCSDAEERRDWIPIFKIRAALEPTDPKGKP